MSELALNSESLNCVLDGKMISREMALQIYEDSIYDTTELFTTAQILRDRFKKKYVTFSKKVFINIVNLCRDTCSYCTYKAEPKDKKLSLMSKSEIKQMLMLGKKYRCVEALLVTGEEPEARYNEARQWLKANGFATTAEYLAHISEAALESGLFPHTNAGNLRREDMKELKKTNVSMGMMLENVSDRFGERGMPHHGAESKRPDTRIKALENAGSLGIPMTTGLLVGIGETPEEIIDSIIAIKKLHHTWGNIQEVIIQNFQPKQDTIMGIHPPTDENYFRSVVALARIMMPEINIQAPPNLSPNSYRDLLSAGINDWGGISPLTPDYVNPEFAWPAIEKVQKNSRFEGFELKCRFPIYPEFFAFASKRLRERMATIEDNGLVMEEYWR